MYTYIKNSKSKTIFDDKIKSNIYSELKKNRIHSEIIEFNSEKELGSVLASLKPTSTNTLVIIGDDDDFKITIGQIGKLNDNIAFGFIPLGKSEIAKSLKISSIQSAVEALAQRRIKEKALYSVSSRYFYDELVLDLTDPQNTNTKKAIINAGKELELRIPASFLKIENLSQDKYFTKTPIQITAFYKKVELEKSTKTNLFQKITNKFNSIKNKSDLETVLSLHGKNFKIQTQHNASDELSRKYNLSFNIGKATKTLRLITKRPSIKSN